ncbi:MAG: CBS domain-containing protein, partial [Methanoregulaceae archaeon]|nr:CBS domain-containing protein [Methanoregulaceae archaeon]
MTIYECCSKDVISVSPEESVNFVANLMEEKNVGCVVVTEKEKPVGIVTDRDLALRGARLCGDNPELAEVSTIMTRTVITLKKDTGIFDAIKVIKE